MNTFLPYPDFAESARCLDNRRLGNQAYRECKTLITGGWLNHPASRMWRGYHCALARYALACLAELDHRGRYYPHHVQFFASYLTDDSALPSWLGIDLFHSSHRAALLYKNPEWYGQFGWVESPAVPDAKGRLPYVWPLSPRDPSFDPFLALAHE